jgi:hypothetical protein
MTDSARNKAIVQGIYQSYTASQGAARDAIYDAMADDLSWRSMGPDTHLHFCKDGTGKQAIENYFDRLYQDWEMLNFDVQDYVAEGAKVVVLSDVKFRNLKNGNIFQSPKADVWTFDDAGKLVDFVEFYDSHQAVGLV